MTRMKPSRSFSVAVAALVLVATAIVRAQPECQIFQEKDLVCTANDNEYILQRGLVSDNNKITSITLRNCGITDIDVDAFENVFYLRHIDLSENRLTRLQTGILDGNMHVVHLNLSYNMLTNLPPGLFVQKPNLEVLDLKGNRLNMLQADLFVPLRKLIHLDLSNNDFIGNNLDQYIFSKNRKIRYLDLSNNDMSDSSENLLIALKELDILNLERCSLKEIPTFATKPNLRTMTQFILSTNQITKIDQARIFVSFENLENLDLAENLIETVAANVFISLKNLKFIVLRYNRLKTLPDGIFRYLTKLENVDLSHNALEHVPLSAFRGTALQSLDISHNRFSYLEDNFCLVLRNYGVRIRQFYFDNNPWQCACLNDILIEVKTFDIAYDSDRYHGMHGVCVTTKLFGCKRQSTDNQLFVEMYDNTILGKGN